MSSRVYGGLAIFAFVASLPISSTSSATFVPIEGQVRFAQGNPICALVLANGQYMFSCDGTGAYSLNVPVDANGQVTLFAFADGFSPYRVVRNPSEFPFNIQMVRALLNSPEISVQDDASCSTTPGFAELSGDVQSSGGTALCAMVLANGQHMFSCGEASGKYRLAVPIDENREVTLFSFADGFQPYKTTYDAAPCLWSPEEARCFGDYDRDACGQLCNQGSSDACQVLEAIRLFDRCFQNGDVSACAQLCAGGVAEACLDDLKSLCYEHADLDSCTQLCSQGDAHACEIKEAICYFEPTRCQPDQCPYLAYCGPLFTSCSLNCGFYPSGKFGVKEACRQECIEKQITCCATGQWQ